LELAAGVAVLLSGTDGRTGDAAFWVLIPAAGSLLCLLLLLVAAAPLLNILGEGLAGEGL
jgi:hypothetical protein